MSQSVGYAIAALALMTSTGVSQTQPNGSRDAWLMQNYRFTGPPAPGTVRPTDPVVSELWRIQNAILSIMRKARSEEDYEAALAAASQASANAQAIGAITERRAAEAAANTTAAVQPTLDTAPPVYLIALRDHTVAAATVYWTDTWMLHYLTSQGSHVQVRLELVDRALSVRLNRERNLEFQLPE
jgi:hypothetical protein